ncbi:hypothetical protein RhiirB3_418690, partial [Rhizophagus irregularis]
ILYHENSCIKGNWLEAINREIDIKSLLECNFSTTTNNSLTASRIVILDAVKAYFSFKMYFDCGIPKITLEGTLEDWIKLQEKKLIKVKLIRNFGQK